MEIQELAEMATKVEALVDTLLRAFPDHSIKEAYKLAIMAGLQDAWRKGYHTGDTKL
jgi:hypothetical protein